MGVSHHQLALYDLIQQHKDQERAPATFTTSKKKPKSKERTDEKKFIKDFFEVTKQGLALLRKSPICKVSKLFTLAKKGIKASACGQRLLFLQTESKYLARD